MPPLVFYLIAASGVAAIYVPVAMLRWSSRRDRRRNPLTRHLLRAPGHSVQHQIDVLSLDILSDAAVIMAAFCFAALGLSVINNQQDSAAWAHGVVATVFGTIAILFMARLVRKIRRRQKLRLGLDGEIATGEELNQFMLRGCHVFHDFPADRFNIDHVVVGPRGVFAVETKARAKPERGLGKEDATVTYDGKTLLFPGWHEREPVAQAMRQAVWLGQWLTRAVGEPVTVHAALALPGWYIKRKASGQPIVFNPKNAKFLAEHNGEKELPGSMIERVAHQIEQRCRDVMPQAFPDTQRRPFAADKNDSMPRQ